MSDLGPEIGDIVLSFLAPQWRARKARKLGERGQIVCSMRALEKTSTEISSRWRNGRATVQPGTIAFKAKALNGTLRTPGPPVTIEVATVDLGNPREPTLSEMLVLPEMATIIVGLTTLAGDQLEWALPPDLVPDVVRGLGISDAG